MAELAGGWRPWPVTRDNDIGDNGRAGPGRAPSVGIRLTAVRGVLVEGNRITAKDHGIALTETSGSTLRANRVGDNAASGIVLFAGSRFNTVEGNLLGNADRTRAVNPRAGIDISIFPGVATAPSDRPPDELEPIDCIDYTVGVGTAGTANQWRRNDGFTAIPAGLCAPG